MTVLALGAASPLAAATAATAAAATAATAATAAVMGVEPAVASVDPGLRRSGPGFDRVVVSGSSSRSVRAAVLAVGGRDLRDLPIIGGVAAQVPVSQLGALGRAGGVTAVTANRAVRFTAGSWDTSTSASPYVWTSQAAPTWMQTGSRGAGVGIAVLDTGVSSVSDLSGRLMQGPDFSGEGRNTVDSFGHGTVMAGIAAGSGAASGALPRTGVAPGATVIAVKVANAAGASDVSTLLAGLSWVAAFKDTYNIRVLNVSWGVSSTQATEIDPLNYAVERLWHSGITVVAAAGNSGPNPATIIKPGDDPLVVTVGAYDDHANAVAADDTVPSWSSQGPTVQGRMKPDLVAPGRTIVTTRAPGSTIERQNPQALVGTDYIKGSGTSEATAVTSGAAALLIAAHPSWTPDQVKFALTSTASRIPGVAPTLQGNGRLQIQAAVDAQVDSAPSQIAVATGLGSLAASRGTVNPIAISCAGAVTVLADESTSWCGQWSSSAWTSSAWTSSAWTSSAWTSSAWTSSAWTSSAWTSSAWTSSAWTSSAWTSSAWTSSAWTSESYSAQGDGSSGEHPTGWFQTAFYGGAPKPGLVVAGEVTQTLAQYRCDVGSC